MNQSFFIGALGAHQQQKALNVTGNNIANVNTYGFKAEKSRFGELMYENLRTASPEEEAYSGLGTHLRSTDTIFTQGGAAQTGRYQDYMIEGDGFFAVKDLKTGEISLTRNGAFMMASREENGKLKYYLTDGDGRFVLDQKKQIMPMEDLKQPMAVGVFDCRNYNGMEHKAGTRFLNIEKNGELTEGKGKVIQGALESSNVDLAQEMTQVIECQRAYSLALKMMLTSDEIETTINNLR